MFSLLKALTIIVSLLIITGCDLTSLDDTALTFSMETDQDNLQASAIMGADTLLVDTTTGVIRYFFVCYYVAHYVLCSMQHFLFMEVLF